MRILLILATALALAGCTRGPVDDRTGMIADAATTGALLASGGFQEANPALGFINNMDPVAGAVTLIAVKVGVEKTIEYMVKDDPRFGPDFAKRSMNAAGWGAACWNASVYLAVAGPLGAMAGLGCALTYWDWSNSDGLE